MGHTRATSASRFYPPKQTRTPAFRRPETRGRDQSDRDIGTGSGNRRGLRRTHQLHQRGSLVELLAAFVIVWLVSGGRWLRRGSTVRVRQRALSRRNRGPTSRHPARSTRRPRNKECDRPWWYSYPLSRGG